MTRTPSGPFAFLSLGDVLLVRPCGFPWTHRRGALNPLLQPTFRSRAPVVKTRSPETARRAPWENPPAFCFEILPNGASPPSFARTPDHLAVIRPPAAPCLTARRRLRVEWLPLPRSHATQKRVKQLSRLQDAPSLEPLTPLPRPEWGARERSRSPVADPAFPGRTSMRPASAGSRRLPPGKLGASTFAGTRPELRARWPAGAMAARVHRCSRTSTRPSTTRLRGRLQAACASTASADRCFNEHGQGPLEHPVPAQCVAGTTACSIDRRLSIEQPPKVRRVRGRGSPNPRRSLPGLLPRETSPRP
jgi:hypothetical protein